MNNDRPSSRLSIGVPLSAVFAIAVCIALYLVGLFFYLGLQFKQTLREFPKRHLEATQAIELAYAYFHEHGRWPTKADLERGGQRWLPSGWGYESNPEFGGPFIWLDGPEHMSIIYRFGPPQQGAVDNMWSLSVEGDKRAFPADVKYSVQSAP